MNQFTSENKAGLASASATRSGSALQKKRPAQPDLHLRNSFAPSRVRVLCSPPLSSAILFLLTSILLPLSASAAPAPTSAKPSFAVYPPTINLETSRDEQSIVISHTSPTGISTDITSQATLKIADENIAKLDKAVIHPVSDGTTQ